MAAARANRTGKGAPQPGRSGNGAPPDGSPGKELLGVAAEHATAQVPTASPGQSVGEVRDAIVGASFESAVDLAVVAGNRLVGIVPIEALLAAQPEVGIEAVMDSDPPVV
ncbi:MAG: hypothetical protein M3M99_02375, partial [Actinomycetota bacterium]|nr:hypothetical protein [Actinomycetota bacterium]